MKFDLSIPRDQDYFADTIASLQNAGVKFYVVREAGERWAEIKFGEDL